MIKKEKHNGFVLTRRQAIVGSASLGALAWVGCKGGSAGPDLSSPEVSAELWQTMGYVRVSADASHGTRVNLYNPAAVDHRVVVQVFRPSGELVIKDYSWERFGPGRSWHIEVAEFLDAHGIALPFEGSMWIGATPAADDVFMGLQGISFDWYGPGHLASVHGMRDFGDSNHDTTWTDLILPKAVIGPRYVSKVAILNASADGVSEALTARPEFVVRDDAGAEVARTALPDLLPYNTTLIDLRDVVQDPNFTLGTMQIIEQNAGLVAYGFVVDTDNDGFVNADHFFDRHFVVDGSPLG